MGVSRLFLLLTAYFVLATFGKELYLITTPNVLLSDAVHKFNIYVSTNVTLVIETTHLQSNRSNRSDVIFLKKGYQSVPYFVPFIGRHLGSSLKLRFIGDRCSSKPLVVVNGSFINESRQFDLLIDNFIIFSETDKPIYKPGDVVKLRAMSIYATNLMLTPPSSGPFIEILLNNGTYDFVPALRSQRTNFESITIETPDNVKMAQWLNVSFEEAMKMTFKLSNDPMFGQWKISLILGSKKEVTPFTVKKYVLPRFVVELYPQPVILMSDKSTNVKICATYSTGKNLQALIKGEICISLNRIICRSFVTSLKGTEGCVNVTIEDTLFGNKSRENLYFRSAPTVNVTVTENGTTHQVTKIATFSQMKRQPYTIKLKSKNYFKPGLPYFGKLVMLRHDGTPQQNTRVMISADSGYMESWGFEQNFTSNKSGVVEFVIPFIPIRSRLSLRIVGEKVNKSSVLQNPQLYHNLGNWESVDNEYIQITPVKKGLKCPGKIQLGLLMNGDVSSHTIYAQMFSRGVIIKMIEFPPIPVKCTNRNDHLGHYECVEDNQVKCMEGWTGDSCLEPLCTVPCQKGACIAFETCSCKTGWTGKFCERCLTTENCVNGYCKYGNDCQCRPGWTGYLCDRKGAIIHNYNNITMQPVTTRAPKPKSKYQNLTIFERYIELTLDKNMGPDLHIVVYYINAGSEVIADSIEISKGLTNCSHVGKGKFNFNRKEAIPGDVVKLFIDPGTVKKSCALRISDVALSQFGQSSNINLGYLVGKLIDLNHKITKEDRRRYGKEVCYTQRRKREARYFPGFGQGYDSRKSFAQSGLTPITNARIVNSKCRTILGRGRENILYDSMPSMQRKTITNAGLGNEIVEIKKNIRDFFPETWIFDYFNVTPTQFNLTVPDSMTTWKANTFCMTDKGVWIAPSRYLKVLLPFFTDIYVPYAIKMGEQLQLPVKLFNYVDDCYEIKAEIMVNASEIKITGPKSFTVCVCSNDVKTLNFNIKAIVIGKLNITVHAQSKYSSFCSTGNKQSKLVNLSDSIRRQLLVEPPGIPSETTYSEIICTRNEQLGLKAEFHVPSEIVSGSLRTYVVYNGDVMGQTFDNLDKLVKMPYGCGEQNMVALVPSIYVLNYLTSMKINDIVLINKAKQYILDGYQRQLTYKHPDGSYSAFGNNDKNGSTWLTAFVVKSFSDASTYEPITKLILKESIQYLEKMQKSNGCFKEEGKLLSGSMAGGLKNKGKTDESLLAAYVLISLANVKVSKTTFNISKAIACVRSGLVNNSSAYRLALTGYALSLHEPKAIGQILSQLQNLSSLNGRYRYWKSGLDSTDRFGQINSADIETTGYALLALNDVQTLPYLSSIIYWLSSKQNSLGGYFSTQDTIVALNAISVFAEKIGTTQFDKVSLSIDLDGNNVRSDVLTNSDRLITRKINIGSRNISYVSITANGTGCISVQLKSLYNIEKLYSSAEEFKITVNSLLTDIKKCTTLELKVCSSYLRKDRNSNMILITVDFPSGWKLGSAEKSELQKQIMTPLKRIDFMENKMHFYYDSFSYVDGENERCLTFRLDESSKIKNLKPSFVRIVDYYKPEIYSDTSYIVPIAICKITNTTVPKREVLCPKCNNDTKDSISDFMTKICPWSYAGVVMAGNKTLRDRVFFESNQQAFYEWTVNLEPSNCSCLKSWPGIYNKFAVISSNYLWMSEVLTFSNISVLYPMGVLYGAYRSDLGNSCYTANSLAKMLTRLSPEFKALTSVNETCASCILDSNLYYKVKNVTEFRCSNQTRWSIKVHSINNATLNGTLTNNRNQTISVMATFPLANCFCLLQLQDLKRSFEIIDSNNVIPISRNLTKEPIKIRLDDKFKIVESIIYSVFKFDWCKN